MTVSRRGEFDPIGVGVQPSGVRLTNQRVILTLATVSPGSSAAELSRRSQLAPQTVAAVIEDLQHANLMRAGEVIRGRRGQPATPYFLNREGAYAIGVEIGWRHVEAVLVNIAGEVIAQYRRDYAYPDARTIFNELATVVRQLSEKLPAAQRSRLFVVGIAAPYGIGRNIDLVSFSEDIRKLWRDTDIETEASKVIPYPVVVFNDGNAACWAEFGMQPRPRPANFAYLLVSTFIGAGIIAEGTLWEGPTGNSANLGSMLITGRDGKQTFPHLVASIYALGNRLEKAGISLPPTTPMFWPWDQWEPHVSEWIEDAAPALAKTLLNTKAVLEYDVAVIDGVMPGSVLDRLSKRVKDYVAEWPALTFDRPLVSKGHLGGAAPALGAAYLPLFRRYFARDPRYLHDLSAARAPAG